jgi:uncharacterized membrane protein YccC
MKRKFGPRMQASWVSFRATIASVCRELAGMSWRGPRARESLKAALSVMLAVALAKALRLDDLWWAAFSGYMVMRSSFDETFRRGVYRIGGTMIGALLGIALAPVMADHPLWRIAWIFAFSALTLYFALLSRYGYAWLFLGITHVMVLAFAVLLPDPVADFARMRVADVTVGTTACVIVSALFALLAGTHPRSFLQSLRGLLGTPVADRLMDSEPGMRRRLLQHVCEAALAMACITVLGYAFRLSAFTQASITVFAVMLLPIKDFTVNRRGAVTRKLLQRCAGCVLGGVAGLLLLLLTGHASLLWWLALATGIWVGQYLQSSGPDISYIGTQFCLGYLTAFVHDVHLAESYAAATERFAGILSGLLILGTILLLGKLSKAAPHQTG